MLITFARQHLSIAENVCDDAVADFVVLSGPNGSGKSHLLEALEQGALLIDGVPPGQDRVIRRFAVNQLAVAADAPQTSAAFRDRWVAVETHLQNARREIERTNPQLLGQPDELERQLEVQLRSARMLTPTGIERARELAGKRISEFTHDDFRRYLPILTGGRDPFQLSVTELFLTYHDRFMRNQFGQWLHAKAVSGDPAISDAEFSDQFGRPPWDLLNETLDLIGLDYSFIPPEGYEENTQYEAQLRHDADGAVVGTNFLSSGEKTLLAIAMSLYTGSRLADAIELPDVLLLDEVDSTLHPSMVRSLLQVVEDTFVRRYGVKVIIVTHSPTTVALAPADSLYIMRRSPQPRLRKASDRDEALSSLTVGLSTLSVRVENRRLIFVESENDEACYQEIFRLVKDRLATELSAEFVASGKGGQGNSDAVRYLVKALREAGNTNVSGLLDRDDRHAAPVGIVFNPERYSIENVVLDPVPLGVFLLREQVVDNEFLAVPTELRHFELTPEHYQAMGDRLSEVVVPADFGGEMATVQYTGGFAIRIPSYWLETRGHDLEDRVIAAFPGLRRFGRNLALAIIEKAFGDVPDTVPASAIDAMQAVLA